MNESLAEVLGRSDTIDVYASPLVGLWMREKAKRDPVAFCRLVQDNSERARRLLGAGARVHWGQGAFMAWQLADLGVPFVFLSGVKGSVFLVSYPGGERAFAADRKMGSAITAVLERLLTTFSGFGGAR